MYWIGYILGVAMLIVGALIISGYLMQQLGGQEGGEMLRTMFGIVLMLYGVYRLAITDMQRRRRYSEH